MQKNKGKVAHYSFSKGDLIKLQRNLLLGLVGTVFFHYNISYLFFNPG